jgi:hypothetical protein
MLRGSFGDLYLRRVHALSLRKIDSVASVVGIPPAAKEYYGYAIEKLAQRDSAEQKTHPTVTHRESNITNAHDNMQLFLWGLLYAT